MKLQMNKMMSGMELQMNEITKIGMTKWIN